MLLKLIVSLVLLISSAAIGYLIALRYSFRVKQLEYFISSLNSLETDILYYSTPLPVAMKRVSNRTHKSISWIFEETWKILSNKDGYGIDETWESVVNRNSKDLSLVKEDIEIVINFAKELGLGNKDSQKKHFEYTKVLLNEQKRKANKEQERNGRLFNRLGILLGLAIVIILI